MHSRFYVSTDQSLLDIDLIHHFLAHQSYWAQGRDRLTVERSIQHSLCFGLYTQANEQIGFARVVTDQAVFAWLMDVFILEAYRGQQLGQYLYPKSWAIHPCKD